VDQGFLRAHPCDRAIVAWEGKKAIAAPASAGGLVSCRLVRAREKVPLGTACDVAALIGPDFLGRLDEFGPLSPDHDQRPGPRGIEQKKNFQTKCLTKR